mmetsp:Transcript_38183/g.58248  ORF Transcript_38183/g.58248 Transcript_38183/m.58248 type:complete len:242 (-) Transcript_38183:790-1515(-)
MKRPSSGFELDYLKLVENSEFLIAEDAKVKSAEQGAKSDYLRAFDSNYNPNMGYPNYKVERKLFFGGKEKKLKIPLSMPHRVIIEANPPRQGYSYLTWNTLNEYYLQKCMNQRNYNEILVECKNCAFKVYDVNREENNFMRTSSFNAFSSFVWMFCCASGLLLMATVVDETLEDKMERLVQAMFIVSIILVFIMSMINLSLSPPHTIFMSYEKYLRAEINKYLQHVSNEEGFNKGCKFSIA